MIYTDARYWDCECRNNYIHLKDARIQCPRCKSTEDECPDSRVNEVKQARLHASAVD